MQCQPIDLQDMSSSENTSDLEQEELGDNPVMESQSEESGASAEIGEGDATSTEEETEEETRTTNSMVKPKGILVDVVNEEEYKNNDTEQ